ncbi:Allantoicase [Sistotremastrum suecicum HHB10207 ss-3]|uniref:Allantoicase n=1 Tax=Sistotremastrum suecicum HHB10207 ss-3 TaxID=1314776 RepID=A0A166H8U1_9AGAM|nr:Allantoicase [Sistotremastrum suecicum HHB10207 ss-3]
MAYKILLPEQYKTLTSFTELSSVALGGSIVSVSDEFFAEAVNLLKVEPAPSMKGQFGPNGALYSGWETKRHNPTYDWVIIRLGAPGSIVGFDIDTSHFNGNEAPEASVDGLINGQWQEILPKVPLGPDARHLFQLSQLAPGCSQVRLNQYPDGGIARFRVYGVVAPYEPKDPSEIFDLAFVSNGGRVVNVSDQHFGVASNVILPGRGKDMGDGWETRRSRDKGHTEWLIIKLARAGVLDTVDIDTAHFKGNYPESCELHAINSDLDSPTFDAKWDLILSRQKTFAHQIHSFKLENVKNKKYTHVRVTIYPDGGLKRVRIYGSVEIPKQGAGSAPIKVVDASVSRSGVHEAKFLSHDEFALFGSVCQAYRNLKAVPPGIKVTPANQGTANKFNNLADIVSSFPEGKAGTQSVSIYRSTPSEAELGKEFTVRVLERHPFNNQVFIPMGSGGRVGTDDLTVHARAYLVIVALNGRDDKPDLGTLKAFIASASQGVSYNAGIWHHPIIALEQPTDFACVETQIGGGDKLDCEVLELSEANGLPVVALPSLD